MGRNTSRVKAKFLACTVAAAGFAAVVTVGSWVRGAEVKQQPSAQLTSLGFKFEGAAGCSNANCHGSATPKPAPKPAANEFHTWQDKDKHAQAFDTLKKDPAKDIMKKLGGGADASTDARCTNCHTLTVPANLRMPKYSVNEGVTCGACHGPYEKWADPHNKEGGANDLRKKAGYATLDAENLPYSTSSPEHQKLLKDVGLYDTRPILARAEKCTSCHLAIDAKLIESGHPQPIFELAYYTGLENPHWREPGGFWDTKVWAAGQVICLRDAMLQLADRASSGASAKVVKDALDQAMGHLGVFKPVAGSALDAAAKDLQGAGTDNAKLASAAKAVADQAGKMLAGVATLKPTAGNTAGLVKKIAADNTLATTAGLRGAQQQALALSSLVNSLKKGGNAAGADAVLKQIDDTLLAQLDEATFKADAFNAALKAVADKVGPMTGNAEDINLK